MDKRPFAIELKTFRGRQAPEQGMLVGYGALIERLDLAIPIPNRLSLISQKSKTYQTEEWQVFANSYQPKETLYKQLVFALKYEGINLLFFKKLFKNISLSELKELLEIEPTGQYSRKIWFLYEWLMQKEISVDVDLSKRKYIPLIDEKLQYAVGGIKTAKQKIINNLPGTYKFCPLIYRTEKLDAYIQENLSTKQNEYLNDIHKDILQRASSFLLLKDLKASFTIEQENPPMNRALRWGKVIAQAGNTTLSIEELERLQQIVIEKPKFIKFGLREEGGFVGEHDRSTGAPIPEHISAKPEDLETLLEGLIETNQILRDAEYDAVLAATAIAFGFVFIHPFVDGNGRIHRYLIHHILAKKKFTQQGVIFPVSASMLDNIADYRTVLQSYSHALLDLIDWEITTGHNIHVVNNTIDYYRYFDATKQAEFLYDCVSDTMRRIIPKEVSYLQNYDEFKKIMDDKYEMPDKMIALLVRFLSQNNGILSKRALQKEFSELDKNEVQQIETLYQQIFY